MDDLTRAIIDTAAANSGLIHRRQLRALGATSVVVRRLARLGILAQVASQVFATGGISLTREQHLRAAHLQAGRLSVISHLACAESWGMPSPRRRLPETSIPHNAPRPRVGHGRIHRTRDLAEADVTTLFDLPHTTPSRTLLDIAPFLRPKRLDRCVQYVCHRRLATAGEIVDLVEQLRRQGRPGVGDLDPIIRRAVEQPSTESVLEDDLQRLIAASDLPAPVTQHPVEIDGHQYFADYAWPTAHLIVETDGHMTHSTKEDRQHDAERLARLQLAGYRVLVFTWDDVHERPAYVLATIRRHLAAAAA